MAPDPDWTSKPGGISAEVPTPGSTLVLAPHLYACDTDACLDLLTPQQPESKAILAVTATEDIPTKLSRWQNAVGDAPGALAVVDIDVATRSATTQPASHEDSPLELTNAETVDDPCDTTAIQQAVISQLAAWQTTDLQPVVCFQPLTTLLEYLDRDELFQLLRVVVGRVTETEAIAHFHLDPRGVDETFLTRLMPLFDTTVHLTTDNSSATITDHTDRNRRINQSLALLDKSSESFFILDSQRRITYYSGTPRNVLTSEQYQLFGTKADNYIHPDDLTAVISDFDEVLASPEATVQTEFRLKSPDTTGADWRWHEARARNYLDEDPIDGVLVSIRDITTRKQQALKLEQQRDRLDEFTSVISHDLRNPLNVASGNIDLAQESIESEYLTRARGALDRIDQMIDDLLMLAQQGDLIDDREPVSLPAVIERCLTSVDTADTTVEVTTDQTVSADTNRLVQLFENLFRNAVEHGGTDVIITVGECADGTGFYVEDNGPGFQAVNAAEVFEKGISTTPGGSGLGLAIVRRIAHAHGWEVAATDGTDGGARFVFTGLDVYS